MGSLHWTFAAKTMKLPRHDGDLLGPLRKDHAKKKASLCSLTQRLASSSEVIGLKRNGPPKGMPKRVYSSSFLTFFFFFIAIFCTRTLGRPSTPSPSVHRPSCFICSIRSPRFKTLRTRELPDLTFKLLSIVIIAPKSMSKSIQGVNVTKGGFRFWLVRPASPAKSP